MENSNLEEVKPSVDEIIQEALKEEQAEPEPSKAKTKKQPSEKQLAALQRGRETRARNKQEKEKLKSQKMRMLEKIHMRVESFDVDSLMKKMNQVLAVRATNEPKVETKVESKTVEIDPPTPEPEPEEEEEPCFFTKGMKPTVYETGQYDFFCRG